MQVDVHLALNIVLEALVWVEHIALGLEVCILPQLVIMELVLLEGSENSLRLPVIVFRIKLIDGGACHVDKDVREHLSCCVIPTVWIVAHTRVSTLLEGSVVQR